MLLLSKVHVYSNFLSLTYCLFSVFFFLFQNPILHLLVISLRLLLLWWFLSFLLFLMNLTDLRTTGQVFCRISFNWNLVPLSVSHDYTGVVRFWKMTEKVLFLSHQGYVLSSRLIPVDINHELPAEVVFVTFFHYAATLFSFFYTICFERKLLWTVYT